MRKLARKKNLKKFGEKFVYEFKFKNNKFLPQFLNTIKKNI